MTEQLSGMIEEITGRKVLTYQSQIVSGPDRVFENFYGSTRGRLIPRRLWFLKPWAWIDSRSRHGYFNMTLGRVAIRHAATLAHVQVVTSRRCRSSLGLAEPGVAVEA
jgi:hypothetical protein